MIIIGQYPEALEEISRKAAPGFRWGVFGREAFLGSPPARFILGIHPDSPTRTQRPPALSFSHASNSPCCAVPSGSLLEAGSSAPSAVCLGKVWQQLPEKAARLLRERLCLIARRLQESRRPASLSTGGTQ